MIAEEKIAKLRGALIGLVGASSREELEAMEDVLRVMPAPAADKAAMIDAIHTLIETDEPSHG